MGRGSLFTAKPKVGNGKSESRSYICCTTNRHSIDSTLLHAGVEMVKGSTDPCKKAACAIQQCLNKNDYQESKCQSVIDALYKCCSKCGPGESLVCEGMYKKKKKDIGTRKK